MSRKNWKVDGVIRALSSKGCVITMDEPITRQITDVELPSQEEVQSKYDEFMKKQDSVELAKDLVLMGSEATSAKWHAKFQEKHSRLLTPRQIRRDITVVPPYTINISEAFELGNGSWAKIDFLCNYQGFSVSKQSMR